MQALATHKCALETMNCIPCIGCGSCKLVGVHHWWVVMLSMSMLLRMVCPSSPLPPATTTKVRYVVTPGRNLLVGIGSMSCCQPCPVQVLTRLVTLWDDVSTPPNSTSLLLMATPWLLYCGLGGRVLQVWRLTSKTCT